MLEITFIGHQGWMLSEGQTHILIDPLLADGFGMLPESRLRVFPPRQINHDKAPPISGVFITHEHDDHFQIASLNHLDRKIPIWLSSRCSIAAHNAAAAMGFEVRELSPETRIDIGDLEVQALHSNVIDFNVSDEWDVVPLCVWSKTTGQCFQTDVDLPPESIVRPKSPPTVSTVSNNFSSLHSLHSSGPAPEGNAVILQALLSRLTEESQRPDGAQTFLLSGAGWSYSGGLEPLNRTAFPVDPFRVCRAANEAQIALRSKALALLPGQTLSLRNAEEPEICSRFDAFLRPASREQWPLRTYTREPIRCTEVVPLLAPPADGEVELQELTDRLDTFAEALFGGRLFRTLLSLTSSELSGKRRSYGLFLQTDYEGGGYLFEYRPSECRFVPVDIEIDQFAVGGRAWASDFLAALQGRAPGSLLAMGHLLEWQSCQTARWQQLSLRTPLWRFAHPLRMPTQFEQTYKGISRRLPLPPSLIPARS